MSDLTISPSGNVSGPSSSTDNAIVRWDGTTGKLIQDSLAIVSDTGNLSCGNIDGINSGAMTITGGTGVANLKLKSNSTSSGKIQFVDSVQFDALALNFPTVGTYTFVDALSRNILTMTSTTFTIDFLNAVITTQVTVPIVYGSASASGGLNISSTSNATKGIITVGTSGISIDETNNRVFTPNVAGSSASGGGLTIVSTTNATKGTVAIGSTVSINEVTQVVTITGLSGQNTVAITRTTATTGVNRAVDFSCGNTATSNIGESTGARCIAGYSGTAVATTIQGIDMLAYCGSSITTNPPSGTARAASLFGAQFRALNATTNTGSTSRLAGGFFTAINHGPTNIVNFYGGFFGVEQTDTSVLGGQTVTNMYMMRGSVTNGSSAAVAVLSGTITNSYGCYVDAYEDNLIVVYTNPPNQLYLAAASGPVAGCISIRQAETTGENRFAAPLNKFGSDSTATQVVDVAGNILASGTIAATPLTTGSVLFSGASGVISQDNANLFWDDSNNRLGLGTATPTTPLDVLPATFPSITYSDGTARNTAVVIRQTIDDSFISGTIGVGLSVDMAFTPTGATSKTFSSYLNTQRLNGGFNFTGTQAAMNSQVNINTSGGTATEVIGGRMRYVTATGSTGAVTSGYGCRGEVSLAGTNTTTTGVNYETFTSTSNVAGTATTLYGFRYNNHAKGAAFTITTIAGFRCEDLTMTATTKVGFWQVGTNAHNRFQGKVALAGDITPTNDLSFDGQSTRILWVERHTTANTSGNSLTVQGGGATSAATDKNGGRLILAPGACTGTGRAIVAIQGYTTATASGTGDGTAVDRLLINGFKALTNNTVTSLSSFTIASNTVIAGRITYAVEVFDGTDLQVEEGEVSFHTTNKAGVLANNNVTKFGNQQSMTAGTLTVTFTITAASPSVLSVNANSSLTPSAGYPRITYALHNKTQQAVTIV